VADQSGTLAQLADELGSAFAAIGEVLEVDQFSDLLLELGLDNPPNLGGDNQFVQKLNDASAQCGALEAAVADLADQTESEDLTGILDAVAKIIEAIAELTVDLEAVATDLKRATTGSPDAANIAAFAGLMVERLIEAAVVRYLERAHPVIERLLALVTIIEVTPLPPLAQPSVADPDVAMVVAGNDPAVPLARRRLHLDRFAQLFQDPLALLRTAYQWGAPNFDGKRLFRSVSDFFEGPGVFSLTDELGEEGDGELSFLFLSFGPTKDPPVSPPGIDGRLYVDVAESAEFILAQLGPDWRFVLKLSGKFGADLGIRLLPPAKLELEPSAGILQGGISLAFLGQSPDPNATLLIFGEPGGSRLRAKQVKAGFIANLEWDGTSKANADVGFEVKVVAGKLVIDTSKSDGFLQKVGPAGGITADFDFAIGWTAERGFFFSGSSGLEVRLPAHINLGPVSLEAITLGMKIEGRKIPVSVGADIKVELGPLVAVVENMGVTATLSFPPGNSGNLGPLQFDLGFKPPNGVGLSLDAGGFKGGGFLRFDSEKGEYAGALELDFKGIFSVKAIGVINTKMPDGSKGFSLLIVIAAEFTPIQLSFGFTLNGVGGIFGLNRGINVNALAEGIRTNAVKSILFPENVIANISRIISDIKQFFPPQPDHFVVGPMAKLGWGPSIITVELGLLLDLPDPMFAIVGVLKALLPTEEAPILRLQVNFLGIVDFDRGYIFFRADLFDSRLLVYSITGSMAFLVSWGEAETFALSVGGFHPDFRDLPAIPALPDGFRSLARIGLSLLSDDNPRLKVESYFAVTSNTVQFGARVELYAEAGGFNVYGFLGYDVLFQFDPFRFVAKLSGGIALRRRSSTIAGVTISATLSGPTPWDARGKATLSLLFFSISVGFHVSWGDPPPAISAATEDLLGLLLREFADTRNWRADLPPNNHLHVSLRKIELPAATEMLVVHPAGVLTFSQRSLPLEDFEIQKFGTKKLVAENKFRITNANSGSAPIPADFQNVREQFALGNFLELSDSEKLSRKSFDKLPSGFKLTATSDLLTTLPVVRPVDYELSYLRRERIVPRGLIKLFVLAYERLVKGSAVRKSGLAQQQTRVSLNAPPQVGLPQEAFAVAKAADLKSQLTTTAGPVLFASQAEAYQQQQELIAQNPALAGQLQVVSHFELNVN
jgi:hypothetical protein